MISLEKLKSILDKFNLLYALYEYKAYNAFNAEIKEYNIPISKEEIGSCISIGTNFTGYRLFDKFAYTIDKDKESLFFQDGISDLNKAIMFVSYLIWNEFSKEFHLENFENFDKNILSTKIINIFKSEFKPDFESCYYGVCMVLNDFHFFKENNFIYIKKNMELLFKSIDLKKAILVLINLLIKDMVSKDKNI